MVGLSRMESAWFSGWLGRMEKLKEWKLFWSSKDSGDLIFSWNVGRPRMHHQPAPPTVAQVVSLNSSPTLLHNAHWFTKSSQRPATTVSCSPSTIVSSILLNSSEAEQRSICKTTAITVLTLCEIILTQQWRPWSWRLSRSGNIGWYSGLTLIGEVWMQRAQARKFESSVLVYSSPIVESRRSWRQLETYQRLTQATQACRIPHAHFLIRKVAKSWDTFFVQKTFLRYCSRTFTLPFL